MSVRIDLTGQKFGRLTVVRFSHTDKHGNSYWTCMCNCRNETTVQASNLKTGRTQSCGCLRQEKRLTINITHGFTKTPTYESWAHMKQRCSNPKNKAYKNYGGRGITVCKRWTNFENFYADMGERPEGLTIERRNNDKGYSPKNCFWATMTEQMRNKRSNRMITYGGEIHCLVEWAEYLKINYDTLKDRLSRHSIQEAFNM